jgi:hypothetical protein
MDSNDIEIHIVTPRRLPGHNTDQAPSQAVDTYRTPTNPP